MAPELRPEPAFYRDAHAYPDAHGSEEVVQLPQALTDAVEYGLRIAQEASFESYIRRVGNHDLRPGRYSILMVLADNPGITPTVLSKLLGRDKSTLTSTLRDLEARKLIARSRRASDGRSYEVALTDEGRTQLSVLRAHAAEHDRLLDRIVGPDKARLMAVLERIAHALRDGAAKPDPVLIGRDRT